MKKLLLAIATGLLMTGCVTVNQPTPLPPCGHPDHGPSAVENGVVTWLQSSPCIVVNNTSCVMTVVQDGRVLIKNVRPGESVRVRPRWSDDRVAVVVTAYTDGGVYAGAASRTFLSPGEIWQVDTEDLILAR